MILFLLILQLTGIVIGAAVVVSFIGIVVLFLYKRYRLSRKSPNYILNFIFEYLKHTLWSDSVFYLSFFCIYLLYKFLPGVIFIHILFPFCYKINSNQAFLSIASENVTKCSSMEGRSCERLPIVFASFGMFKWRNTLLECRQWFKNGKKTCTQCRIFLDLLF